MDKAPFPPAAKPAELRPQSGQSSTAPQGRLRAVPPCVLVRGLFARWKWCFVHASLFSLALLAGCQTKSDVRREQEVVKLRKEVQKVRGDKADIEVTSEEMKADIARLGSLIDERAQYQTVQFEAMQKEIEALTHRVESLESRPVPEPARAEVPVGGGGPVGAVTFDQGKKYYDAGKFEEAIEVFHAVVKKMPRGKDKKARYWLAESLYASKDFGAAALEFGDFKKKYPNDDLVPKATYRQANAFRSLKKTREAKLFYQELIDRFPKSPLVPKAKAEMAGLK